MMDHRMKQQMTRLPAAITVCFFVGFLLAATGCSTFRDIKRATVRMTSKTAKQITKIGRLDFSDSGLKKKVLIAGIADTTSFPSKDFGQSFQKTLSEHLLSKCQKGLFVKIDDPVYKERLGSLPGEGSGQIDNFKLIDIGRQLGLNNVIRGTVINIRDYTEERGLFWFRDTYKFLQVLVNVEVYDMETGAKLVDKSHQYETKLDILEFEDIEPDKKALIPMIDEAIAEAAEILGNRICDALGEQPWAGFITQSADGTVEISSGSEVGLSNGQVLAVYARGEVIRGAENQRFLKPGEKIGEIRITAIHADRAAAERLDGDGGSLPAGSIVRPK